MQALRKIPLREAALAESSREEMLQLFKEGYIFDIYALISNALRRILELFYYIVPYLVLFLPLMMLRVHKTNGLTRACNRL